MKRSLYISLFIMLISCNSKGKLTFGEAQTRVLTGNFDAYASLPECACDSLSINEKVYSLKDSLFTGTCFTYYKNESHNKLESKQILKGKVHGAYVVYSPTGDTLDMDLYKHGKLVGKSIGDAYDCPCDSLKTESGEGETVRKSLFGYYYNGDCYSNYPETDTLKYIKRSYKDGYLEGNVLVYDKLGNIISKQAYENGELKL